MDEQSQNDEQQVNDAPAENQSEQNAPAPVDETKAAPKARARKGAASADKPANDKVLGEGEDADFDPVAHGQQTALENHVNEQSQ